MCNAGEVKIYSILLAEDNLINSTLFSKALEHYGHNVTVVENGEDAVMAARNKAFDVILMDIDMPVMNGIDATFEIRKFNCLIPIIAFTSSVEFRCGDYYQEFGMDGYVNKIIQVKELQSAIESVIWKKINRR